MDSISSPVTKEGESYHVLMIEEVIGTQGWGVCCNHTHFQPPTLKEPIYCLLLKAMSSVSSLPPLLEA